MNSRTWLAPAFAVSVIALSVAQAEAQVTSTPPRFNYTPSPAITVEATGGMVVGSTSNLLITPMIVGAAGVGDGAAATTTLTCTAPTAPFAGFGQTVTAVGAGAITGGPLTGTCTLGAQPATQILACTENQGGIVLFRSWTLSCPAGETSLAPATPINTMSLWSLITLMLALFGFAASTLRRQG